MIMCLSALRNVQPNVSIVSMAVTEKLEACSEEMNQRCRGECNDQTDRILVSWTCRGEAKRGINESCLSLCGVHFNYDVLIVDGR
jgi:hypothetical protein